MGKYGTDQFTCTNKVSIWIERGYDATRSNYYVEIKKDCGQCSECRAWYQEQNLVHHHKEENA